MNFVVKTKSTRHHACFPAKLLRPVGGSMYLVQTDVGRFVVNLTCSQFLSIYDNGGDLILDEHKEFLTGVSCEA